MKAKTSLRRRRVLTRYSAEDRERLMKEQEASGLTRAQFCVERGIKLTTFHGWFKAKRQRESASPKFVRASIPMKQPAAIEIELPRGVCIRVRDGEHFEQVKGFIREVAGC